MEGNDKRKENLGNTTNQVFKKKVKNAIMTLHKSNFDKMELIIKYLEHYKAFKYLLICEHDGPNEEHRHIYVQYENARTLDSRYLYGCHLEEAFGSAQKNIEYLQGEDKKHKDLGIKSTQIYENGQASFRGNINTIGQLKKITDINDVPPQHFNTWNKVKNTKIKLTEWHKKIKVIYIYCKDSGIGKSYLINKVMNWNKFEEFDEVKHVGEFWHGINGDEVNGVAVYDDFRDSDMKASEFINFIDYNIHNLNYKHGSAKNKYSLIIITSIQNPYDLYKNVHGEPRKQWIRRLKIIDLSKIITNNDNIHNHEQIHDDLSYESIPDYDKYKAELV